MIGDVPQGAPLRCTMGRHIGQSGGGTMAFTCPRCGGSYWQTQDMRDVTARADAMIAAGDEGALDYARDEIRRRTA